MYEPHSFYGDNAIESRKYAVISFLEILDKLQLKLEVNLKPYVFKPAREHYGMIKNDLAVQCNRNKEKIYIRDNIDGEWLWIDDSLQIGELETGGEGVSKDRAGLNLDVQKWWNDNKKHNFKVTPTFLMESIKEVTKNQMIFDANMSSHLEVLENIGKAITQLKEEIKKLNGNK